MPAKKAIKIVKTNKTATIQLWYGENQSLLAIELSKWLGLFRAKYPAALVRQFVYNEVNQSELAAALHQSINSNSFFASKTFIVITDCLAAEAKSEVGKLIEQACSQPPADLILVLIETKKIAWSKPLPKIIKKSAEAGAVKLKEYLELPLVEIERWIVTQAKERNGKFAPQATRILAQAVGNDFIALDNEIAKLIAWRGDEEVRSADIDLLVTPKLTEDVFAFIDAVGRRDMRAAQETLNRQFAQGVSPQSLIGLLAWHVRVLAIVRQSLDSTDKRLAARELAENLGLHPFVVTKALQQIPYYSAERVAWLYGELSSLDVKLKSTRTEPEVLFSLFLSKLSVLKPATGSGLDI